MTGFESSPLKWYARFQTGCTPSGRQEHFFVDGGVPWVRPGELLGERPIIAASAALSAAGIQTVSVVPAGSTLLCCIGSIGNIGFAGVPVATNQQITAITPDISRLTARYLLYSLVASQPALDALASSNVVRIINNAQLGGLRLALPPLPTQKAIADFLDKKTAAIDALIEKKQKLLTLLAEKRAALINQAVTKGLDPNVPMKDSGIPWIGEIPAHWEVKRLKQLGNLKGGAGFPDTEQGVEGEDIPFFKVKHLATVGEGGTLDSSDDTVSVMTAARLRAHVFAAGTVVFAKVGAALLLRRYRLLGRPSCIDNNMLGFTVHEKWMDVGFLMPSLTLLPFDLLVNPGAVPSISAGQVGSFPLATPPVEEQRQIADHLNRELAKADKATRSIVNQLNKLAEYRQALITAAVTGQLDIGEAA